MKKFATIATIILLTGCASQAEYYAAIERANLAQVEASKARSAAEADRIAALSEMAASGDESARIAAVMGIAMMNRSSQNETKIIEPRQQTSEALKWAQVLVPFAGLGLQAHYGYQLGKVQSDNNAQVAISGQEAYTELGLGEFRDTPSARFGNVPSDAFPLGEGRDVLVQPSDSFPLGEGRPADTLPLGEGRDPE